MNSTWMGSTARGLALVISMTWALIACERRVEPAGEGAPSAAASKYERIELRFSDPGNAGVMAFGKREHSFDAELAKYNATIVWVPAAGAFSANFEAMNAGAINSSGGAVSPVVGALAHDLKFRIFAIGNPAGVRQAGVLAPKGSEIRSLQDLVGKRVAVNWAAHGDYVLLKALERAGVPADKVVRVPIQPPEAAAAFATGKIDAWSTFGVFFSTAVKNGARVLAAESEIESDDVSVNAASEVLLKKNPEAFRAFIRVVERLSEQARREPEKFQNVFTDKGPAAVSGDLLREAIEDTRNAPRIHVPSAEDKSRVARVAKLLFDNRSIDRDIRVDEIVFDLDAARQHAAVAP
ncbi:MAG TPA: NrtA/SsuA/CpmA family ABC transporter substrate-binding protein [Polyangiaceae bacterium]|nr:NrtA/SsuA/CpmA family ABC transporter substrate-binding protein [Polyangiaceae bacterium]